MSRTSPFFVPQKEIDLIDSMNEELIDEIIGQSVDIYKVSIDNTDENIYGESTTKYYEVGFRVNCLIQFDSPTITQDNFGTDTNSSIELLINGDVYANDLNAVAKRLILQSEELLDVEPVWQDGMVGVMQLVVLAQAAQMLRERTV